MPEENNTRERALEILSGLAWPGFQKDIVAMGMVQDLEVEGSVLSLRLSPGSGNVEVANQLEAECRRLLSELPGVDEVRIRTERSPVGSPAPSSVPQGHDRAHMHSPPQPGLSEQQVLPGVQRIIAVASGKGGVGKSTVAVNLAAALGARGKKVGILDADVYGPSIPTMLGIHRQPEVIDNRMYPVEAHGLKTLSMGYFVDPDKAVIWRGPMVMKALQQFLQDAEWGELDYLVVDLPPGTGDAQLTMVQLVPLNGAVVVTTPQEVALADARKAVNMFRTTNCPVLGIVENMSTFVCPCCNTETEIFSRGGGREEASKLGVPFLAEIPITPNLRATGDEGTPLVLADPGSPATEAFGNMAGAVEEILGAGGGDKEKKGGVWPFRKG